VSFSALAADMLGALLVVAMLAWLRERQRSPALGTVRRPFTVGVKSRPTR
jgi:hypothetical protein